MEFKIRPLSNLAFHFEKVDKPIKPGYAEKLAAEILEKEGYEVFKNNKPKGIPDFTCKKGKSEFYVEIKSQNDSLRISQMQWIEENLDKPVIVFAFVVSENKESKNRRAKKSDGICERCAEYFEGEDLTFDEEEKICFNCLRKKMFLERCDKIGIILSVNQIKYLFSIKKQMQFQEMAMELKL